MPRVVIDCPETGDPTPTGYWSSNLDFVSADERRAFRCSSCGDIHEWSRTDARLEQPARLWPREPARDAP
jgi:hypothetical protein